MISTSSLADRLSAVVAFWRDASAHWFHKSDAFDDDFRRRFLALHELAAHGELNGAAVTPKAALGLVILLDQFPRNAFRGSPRMYATDPLARAQAVRAIGAGFDAQAEPELRGFFYLPLSHSESLSDQERAVALNRAFDPEWLRSALGHCDVVQRFGRFPHRNAVLGRVSTPQELAFLAAGGFAG
ncbi:MAG: DUF924 family protein [Burkholderiales bacterium]